MSLTLAGLASAATPRDIEQRIREVQQLAPPVLVKGETPLLQPLARRMSELKVRGVSVAVIHQGRIEWARGFGVTRTDGPAVTENTLFQAASISKPVFALAVLHLVEAGKLDLDANVNDYLKDWKLPDNDFTRQSKVTLRGILSHTAGLTVSGFPGYAADSKLPSTTQILDGSPSAALAVRVDILPGSLHRYSGGGYVIAQQVLLDVTGIPLPKLMHDSVLAPLGMKLSTYQQPLPAARFSEVATPYLGDGTPVPGGPHVYPEMAAAGLWTTPTDLARYALGVQAALAGKSKKVISARTARAMLTTVIEKHGLGPQVGGATARKYFMHGGSNEGYRCALVAYEDGEGAIVMTNSDRGGELMSEIMRTIAHVYQWPDFAPPTRTLIEVKPESLDRFVGVYELNDGSMYVVRKDGARLVGHDLGKKALALFPSSEREFFGRDANVVVDFAIGADGNAKTVRHTLRDAERNGVRLEESRSRQILDAVERDN